MATKRLRSPLNEDDVRELNIWDVVYLDGLVFTGRSLFHTRAIENDVLPPVDFSECNIMLHMGGIMRRVKDHWKPVSLLCTSSIRFETLGPQIIDKLGLRAIIGKGTMGAGTMAAMKQKGCVHLAWGALIGNGLARRVKKVVNVFDLETLGPMDATWLFEVEEFGPFIVDIDTKGRNLFDDAHAKVKSNLSRQFAEMRVKNGPH